MQVLDAEKWKQKLSEARRTGKLNISYLALPEITASQVEDIKVRTHDADYSHTHSVLSVLLFMGSKSATCSLTDFEHLGA